MEEQNNNNDALAENSSSDLSMSLLTLRMIMQGKEVGSIIGKKGDNVRKFREESGARINISDASCPERIVTVTGTTDQIVSALTMICKRLEEDGQYFTPGAALAKQPITLRFIIPANQCGSLIGKGGAKIKEIRDAAGASIQISSEMLPQSTERVVTVSGGVESVSRGIFHICSVMLESPPKGTAIPYRPKTAVTPVILAGGQAYAVNGQYFISQPDLSSGQPTMLQYHPVPQYARMVMQQGMMGHAALSPYLPHHAILAPSYQCGYIRAPSSQGGVMQNANQTHEISIPNDLIGCIIGRGGSKINEIRQASGANIKIANVEEGSPMRLVTISGPPEAINAAQYLINASLEMPKNMALTLDPSTCSSGSLASRAPELSLFMDLHGLPQSSINDATHHAAAAFANSVNVQSVELNPAENAADHGAKSMPSSALALKRPRPVLNSQNPLSPVGFTLVKSPVVPPSSLVYSSNTDLPRTPSVQCDPLTLTPQPSSFTIPPVPIVNGFIGAGFVHPQRNFASKVKAGICLINKFGQKYFPY